MKTREAFEPYMAHMTTMGMSRKTVENDKILLYGTLSHSIQDMEIADIRMADVAKVIEAGRRHGRYGAQRSVVVLRKLVKFAKDSGETVAIDWREIKIPNVPKKQNEYLSEEELEALLNAIDLTTQAGIRTRALLEVLYATGMRIGEAISLDKEGIDWENKEAVVTNVKSKDREKVYFSNRSLDWLKRYLESRKDDSPSLFISGRARMVRSTSGNYIRIHLQELANKLGIRKTIKHHLFRKTFVTHLLQRKADIIAVRDLARHRSERTTLQSYAAVNKERSKAVHAEIINGLLA